ncbi:TPA: hypothetical protein ACH56K_000009 [Enterococcus faecium]
MVTFKDLLPEPTESQQAFILDHGKTEDDGQLKYADDAKSYGWNMRQYGKLKAGAVVLNRHPGKLLKTVSGKFTGADTLRAFLNLMKLEMLRQ